MIVQALHHIQNHHGYLPHEEMVALARTTGTPMYRLMEVASFFPHFRMTPPPYVEVLICRDYSCHQRGAGDVRRHLEAITARLSAEGKEVRCGGVSCLGRCDRAPVMVVNRYAQHAGHTNGHAGHGHADHDLLYVGRSPAEFGEIVTRIAKGDKPPTDDDGNYKPHTPVWTINEPYNQSGPTYEAVKKFLAQPDPKFLIQEIEQSKLRGMGGPGAPAFKKWNDAYNLPGEEKYVVVNGDESEPGTFKDREILLRAPHLVIEGVVLGGLLTNATRGYIYIRHEYPEEIEACRKAIKAAEKIGACGENVFDSGKEMRVEVFVSPGGYICGEQSALIEAMEDKRAQPRNRPPELGTNGYLDKPTLLSNVETFAWVPSIVMNGGAWYRDQGVNGCFGKRFISISGDLNRPGAYEIPVGLTYRELIMGENYCRGIRGNRGFRAIATSGPSGGIQPALVPVETLPRGALDRLLKSFPSEATKKLVENAQKTGHVDMLDVCIDVEYFNTLEFMLGAGQAVYAEGTDILSMSVNGVEFYRNESCGKCVPCRIGTQKLVGIGTDLAQGRKQGEDVEKLVADLSNTMEMTSICGLGMVAANPLVKYLKYFQS
jgi:NADH:ubiquinone oxidoreductase subunit F (NADH-binding)/NADH:ubiquinone oxidoreductase subunit E